MDLHEENEIKRSRGLKTFSKGQSTVFYTMKSPSCTLLSYHFRKKICVFIEGYILLPIPTYVRLCVVHNTVRTQSTIIVCGRTISKRIEQERKKMQITHLEQMAEINPSWGEMYFISLVQRSVSKDTLITSPTANAAILLYFFFTSV